MATASRATVEDLYRVRRKAEIVDGQLRIMEPSGFLHGRGSLNIVESLRGYERTTKAGFAIPDNVGFLVNLPNRQSFSPDAAFHTGQPTGIKFLEGAPVFAVEVRSEGDYGPAAERDLRTKRADYFAAGTLVVWDIDLLSEDVVKVYRASAPDTPTIYRRGEVAEAEPAVPDWRLPVDAIFE